MLCVGESGIIIHKNCIARNDEARASDYQTNEVKFQSWRIWSGRLKDVLVVLQNWRSPPCLENPFGEKEPFWWPVRHHPSFSSFTNFTSQRPSQPNRHHLLSLILSFRDTVPSSPSSLSSLNVQGYDTRALVFHLYRIINLDCYIRFFFASFPSRKKPQLV